MSTAAIIRESFLDKFGARWAEAPRITSSDEKDRVRAEIVAACILAGDCWLYPHVNAERYGIKRIEGKNRVVSRFMLCYSTRESIDRPSKIAACHDTLICPYRNCCNPRHLFWGTYAENSKQRESDERIARQEARTDYPMPAGGLGHDYYTVNSQGEGH